MAISRLSRRHPAAAKPDVLGPRPKPGLRLTEGYLRRLLCHPDAQKVPGLGPAINGYRTALAEEAELVAKKRCPKCAKVQQRKIAALRAAHDTLADLSAEQAGVAKSLMGLSAPVIVIKRAGGKVQRVTI